MPPDPIDPCQEAADLRKARRNLIVGQGVTEVRHGERLVKWSKGDIGRLDALIAEAEKACAAQTGETPKRRRYAMGARVRPY